MKFDHSYIVLLGHIVFEPMVILTNIIFFIFCAFYYSQLNKFSSGYAKYMRRFILLTGVSALIGALGHGVHYQMGVTFFNSLLFTMNLLTLISIFYCFKGPYTYYHKNKKISKRYIYVVMAWIAVLVFYSFIDGNFLIIKIHAGISLVYSFCVHYIDYKRYGQRGSFIVVSGIAFSFLAIIAHSLKISLHKWFNYKDISHCIMIIAVVIIYQGIRQNVEKLELQTQ